MPKHTITDVDRRRLISGAVAGAAAIAAAPTAVAAQTSAESVQTGGDTLIVRDDFPLADTEAGRLRGYVRGGIHVFKGIPYAESTAGANRFMPPVKRQSWTGIRSALAFGPVSPQGARTGWADDEQAFLFNWNDGIQGEDCLRLNVWSPGLADGGKRPVMVWLHGGGFTAGSGQEHPAYDGENLARRGNAVVVTLNHRLGPVGHLNLAKYGPAYASSANVGMLDIVAALRWVRNNIANFGGNPEQVMIFGQSGGGGKVNTLMAMPSAKGLFHRAVVESGSMLRANTEEASAAFADQVLAELGIGASNLDTLQSVAFDKLIAAGNAVQARNRAAATAGGGRGPDIANMAQNGWGPVVDGAVLPRHPFDPDAPSLSADVPLLVGNVQNEFFTATSHPEYAAMNEADATTRMTGLYGDRAAAVFALYRKDYPNATPFQIYSQASAATVRAAAIRQATLKAAQGGAPAWLYWFTWQTPVLSGRPEAFHCSEIAFVFNNTDIAASMTGGGPRAKALAAKVSDAWIAFAHSGNPNHRGLPDWPAFTAANGATMILDDVCRVKNAPDAAEQAALAG